MVLNMTKDKKFKIKYMVFGQLLVLWYSLAGIMAKLASEFEFLSHGFIGCYLVELVILGIYSILWQQILKHLDLSVAYANKAVSLLWSSIWAVTIFHEQLSLQNVIGILVVAAGTIVVNMNE